MPVDAFILDRLPHRPPFLWLDRVVEIGDNGIHAEKDLPIDLDVFRGHYPGYPLMPGVLLCEAVFQAGAILAGELVDDRGDLPARVPVLTRIQSARFKRQVHPGETIGVHVKLKEQVSSAWFFKGTVRVAGKVALQVEFACALQEG